MAHVDRVATSPQVRERMQHQKLSHLLSHDSGDLCYQRESPSRYQQLHMCVSHVPDPRDQRDIESGPRT